MSFAARFYFDGGNPDGYEVRTCDYFFDQTTDDKGRPSSDVRGGALCVIITSTDDVRSNAWMLDPYSQKDGRVDFYRADQESVMKKVSFENAYCVSHTERMKGNLETMLMLSAEVITVNGATHRNKW